MFSNLSVLQDFQTVEGNPKLLSTSGQQQVLAILIHSIDKMHLITVEQEGIVSSGPFKKSLCPSSFMQILCKMVRTEFDKNLP